MTATQATRLAKLQACMTEEGLGLFVIQDPDSMVAFAGFWNYLGMEFGRATLLAVPRDGTPVLIAPGMCFAVDGGITVEGEFSTRVGDSVVVTEDGFEYLTDFPRELAVL